MHTVHGPDGSVARGRVIQWLGPIAAYHITNMESRWFLSFSDQRQEYTIPLSKLDFLDGLEFGEERQKIRT